MTTGMGFSGFFLQGGRVAERLVGVSGRFGDGGAANAQYLVPILITLGIGLLALVGYRALRWRRFKAALGEGGFGLDRRLLWPLWRVLDESTRNEPGRLVASREMTASLLESLAGRDRAHLQREFLHAFIGKEEDLRQPLEGLDNLVQLERLRLKRSDGLLLEGFLRRVGQHAIDFVAIETPMQLPFQDEMLEVERANGELFEARALRITGLHGPWTLGVGEAAVYGHRREEFRVSLAQEGLCFISSPRLDKIRMDILEPPEPVHHLIAKRQAENPDTHEILLAKGQHFASAQIFRFDDLSAMGARIRMTRPKVPLKVDDHVFLFMPFEINGRRENHFISTEIVEVWSQSLDGKSQDQVMRCRFFDIKDEEVRAMRVLVNQIAGTKDGTRSLAREILAANVRQPVARR